MNIFVAVCGTGFKAQIARGWFVVAVVVGRRWRWSFNIIVIVVPTIIETAAVFRGSAATFAGGFGNGFQGPHPPKTVRVVRSSASAIVVVEATVDVIGDGEGSCCYGSFLSSNSFRF